MKKFKIIILKSDVLDITAQTTLYAGKKTEAVDQSALMERVSTGTADAEVLARYWQDACTHIVDSLSSFIAEATMGRESLSLIIETSNSYDDTLIPAVESGLQGLAAAIITYRWFQLALPARAAEWKSEALHRLACIQANLFSRKKPERKI